MALDIVLTLVAGFLFVALVSGYLTSAALSAASPERRRLRELGVAGVGETIDGGLTLIDAINPKIRRLPGVPKSPKDMNRLRRRLAMGGYNSATALAVYGVSTIAVPTLLVLGVLAVRGISRGWVIALVAGLFGYMLPQYFLSRRIRQRKQEIRDGLPDALDLFIVCVEAGSGLDQAIVKATDELGLTYPALTQELRMITTEIRAGKPRVDAFKNFAARWMTYRRLSRCSCRPTSSAPASLRHCGRTPRARGSSVGRTPKSVPRR